MDEYKENDTIQNRRIVSSDELLDNDDDSSSEIDTEDVSEADDPNIFSLDSFFNFQTDTEKITYLLLTNYPDGFPEYIYDLINDGFHCDNNTLMIQLFLKVCKKPLKIFFSGTIINIISASLYTSKEKELALLLIKKYIDNNCILWDCNFFTTLLEKAIEVNDETSYIVFDIISAYILQKGNAFPFDLISLIFKEERTIEEQIASLNVFISLLINDKEVAFYLYREKGELIFNIIDNLMDVAFSKIIEIYGLLYD